jgi:hypothetical protein
MNLNKDHKAAIVRKIMADIPVIDYSSQANALLQAKAIEKMPDEVRAIYDNPDLRCWLQGRFVYFEGQLQDGSIFWRRTTSAPGFGGHTMCAYRAHNNIGEMDCELVAEVKVQMDELARAAEAQWRARRSMEDKLFSVLSGIRTLKQAKTLLEPELHKYLPFEPPQVKKPAQASTALVPYVVANLREMGWPKDQEPKTEGAA